MATYHRFECAYSFLPQKGEEWHRRKTPHQGWGVSDYDLPFTRNNIATHFFMMMYLRALPKVCPSSRNSKEAAVGVDPGNCQGNTPSVIRVRRGSLSRTLGIHTRNNLFSS